MEFSSVSLDLLVSLVSCSDITLIYFNFGGFLEAGEGLKKVCFIIIDWYLPLRFVFFPDNQRRKLRFFKLC